MGRFARGNAGTDVGLFRRGRRNCKCRRFKVSYGYFIRTARYSISWRRTRRKDARISFARERCDKNTIFLVFALAEISCESLASRAFKASCSFVYDTSRNDAIRAGDCVKLAVRYALQGLVEDDLFSVTKLEAHFSDGTKASTTTSTSEIVDEMVLIPFTVQSKTQRNLFWKLTLWMSSQNRASPFDFRAHL